MLGQAIVGLHSSDERMPPITLSSQRKRASQLPGDVRSGSHVAEAAKQSLDTGDPCPASVLAVRGPCYAHWPTRYNVCVPLGPGPMAWGGSLSCGVGRLLSPEDDGWHGEYGSHASTATRRACHACTDCCIH